MCRDHAKRGPPAPLINGNGVQIQPALPEPRVMRYEILQLLCNECDAEDGTGADQALNDEYRIALDDIRRHELQGTEIERLRAVHAARRPDHPALGHRRVELFAKVFCDVCDSAGLEVVMAREGWSAPCATLAEVRARAPVYGSELGSMAERMGARHTELFPEHAGGIRFSYRIVELDAS